MDRSSVRVIVTILVLKTQNYLAGCTNKSLLQHSQAMNKIELVALHQTSSLISKPRELEKDAEQKRVNHHDHATEFLALTSFIPIVELNFYLISHCTNHFKSLQEIALCSLSLFLHLHCGLLRRIDSHCTNRERIKSRMDL